MMWEALKRADHALYALRFGERAYRTGDGINLRMPKGHGVEQRSHFPGRAWLFAAWTHNQLEPRAVLASRRIGAVVRLIKGGA